jgi:hypothetical protein
MLKFIVLVAMSIIIISGVVFAGGMLAKSSSQELTVSQTANDLKESSTSNSLKAGAQEIPKDGAYATMSTGTNSTKAMTSPVMQLEYEGTFHSDGKTYPYFLARATSANGEHSGTLLIHAEPIDIVRSKDGKPVVYIKDPKNHCDLVLPGGTVPCSGPEVAKAVAHGLIKADETLEITLPVVSYNSAIMRHAALQAARQHCNENIESPIGQHVPIVPAWDVLRSQAVMPLWGRRLLVVEGDRFPDFALVYNGSSLSEIRYTGLARAGLIAAIFGSSAGVTFTEKRFAYVWDLSKNEARTEKLARDVAETLYKAAGAGGLELSKFGDNASVKILMARTVANEMLHKSTFASEIIARGNNPELLNTVLAILQRESANIFTVTANEVEASMKSYAAAIKAMNADSLVNEIAGTESSEKLDDKKLEELDEKARSHFSKEASGGSVAVPLFGGSKISTNEASEAEATKRARKEAAISFCRQCRDFNLKGALLAPRSLDLCIVDKNRIEKNLKLEVKLITAGAVRELAIPSSFNSALPTLSGNGGTAAELPDHVKRLKELQRMLDKE